MPIPFPLSDLRSRYEARIDRLSEQLADSCPELSPETRVAFAAQIAVAALSESRREHPVRPLYELGGRNN
jgi:hypothetical protein